MAHPEPYSKYTIRSRLWIVGLSLAGLTYLFLALRTLWYSVWRDPYADQWRLYRTYLELPFPQNIFVLENGHRPVLPAIVRVAEIHWFHANQKLQLTVGFLLAATTLILLLWKISGDARLNLVSRVAACAFSIMAICWMGNVRTLAHCHETVHAYLVTSALLAGLILADQALISSHRLRLLSMLAAVCAVIATFSFGTGIATFVAIAAVYRIRRAPVRSFVPLVILLAVCLALYIVLPGAREVRGYISIAPLVDIRNALQWLAGPAVHLSSPFLDPIMSFSVLRYSASAFANSVGSVYFLVWPQTLLGLTGVLLLLFFSYSAWRSNRAIGSTESLGFGLGWFSLTAALVVGITRTIHFKVHLGDVYAYRYTVWECLFWLGLGLIVVSRPEARVTKAGVAGIALILILGFPSEISWVRYCHLVSQRVHATATGLVVGVLDPDRETDAIDSQEVLNVLQMFRDRRLAMFAWPVANLAGTQLSADVVTHQVEPEKFEVTPVTNLLNEPGMKVQITLPKRFSSAVEFLFLLDRDRRLIGLAVPAESFYGPRSYFGYLRGNRAASELAVGIPQNGL